MLFLFPFLLGTTKRRNRDGLTPEDNPWSGIRDDPWSRWLREHGEAQQTSPKSKALGLFWKYRFKKPRKMFLSMRRAQTVGSCFMAAIQRRSVGVWFTQLQGRKEASAHHGEGMGRQDTHHYMDLQDREDGFIGGRQ